MRKRFNDTGVCVPGEHFMVDVSETISKIFYMVEQNYYFVINKPRQYGKTTIIYMLNAYLKK